VRARHAVLPVAAVALLALGSAGAEGPPTLPTAAASATAIRVAQPGQPDVVESAASAPPAGQPAAGPTYAYPADGSVVSVQSTLATATTGVHAEATAAAESDITALSLFGGAVTADAVTAKSTASTSAGTADGTQSGTGIVGLLVGGKPLGEGVMRVHLPMGTLVIDDTTVDSAAPAGSTAYHGVVVALDVTLTQPYGGLAVGTEIQIGIADAAVQTAPVAPTTTSANEPPVGDRPEPRPLPKKNPLKGPLRIHPKLTAGRYVFPVYGSAAYIDTFGAPRSDETYHHGDDIFGELGQPILAVTSGTLFSVGFEKVGGYRLWLLDQQGNQFYYAHLSAYSTLAVNGAHVRAGQVIGFMGNTGDAEGTPVHLHFEIHPVSLLYLGYDGAVDPTKYLDAWKHQKDLPFPVSASFVAALPGGGSVPEPGAILLGSRDISSAVGLDAASLRRALAPPQRATLMQTLVPSITPRTAPKSDLGRG
jgi:murein DD-endopeptidase MepM/ murein hydrolase activator NlpD